MAKELTTGAAVAQNLRALMKRHGMNQSELARKSGVSQRHISSILSETAEATTEKVAMLAKPFGLKGWQLQVPGLPEELLDSSLIGDVLQALAQATPEGRDLIAKQARREAFFSKRSDKEL